MIRFVNGPAAGVQLNLRRTPLILRVVENTDFIFDALDQLDDKPKPDEIIFLYRLTAMPTAGFVDYGGRDKHKSGAFISADYEYLHIQPQEKDIWDARAYNRWLAANYKWLRPDWAKDLPLSGP